ncbi:MAG: hypothetical protein IT323_09460 [Anaerolineae bacterium]|nr:hypothetical protein [Anaerolineae bacterium]
MDIFQEAELVIALSAAGAVVCALMAMQTARLLLSALWLACCSALVATLLFQLNAPEVAVIELSVGAGLVTVLFVFAVGIAGEGKLGGRRSLPIGLAAGFALIAVMLIGWLLLPAPVPVAVAPDALTLGFTAALWEQRALDVVVQLALIFSGVLGVLGLLADHLPAPKESVMEALETPLGSANGHNGHDGHNGRAIAAPGEVIDMPLEKEPV